MVISIEIPRATENTSTVEGFSATPTQPIIPAVIIKGIIFGISEQIRILKDLNKYSIQSAISTNAQITLSLRPFIIYALPSRKVTLVPVNNTLYLAVSNNWLLRREMVSR